MPQNLRQRKGTSNTTELPSSFASPKPELNDGGHVALNKQGPTIVPTVFVFLIVGLLVALPPIFYFTQVMIPDPESTSTLSQFRIKGNILLNALGHTSSVGKGRIPFSPQKHTSDHHQPLLTTPTNQKENIKIGVDSTEANQKSPKLDHETKLIIEKQSTIIKQKIEEDSSSPGKPTTDSKPSISVVSSIEELKLGLKEAKEDQQKIDEELGKFWQASSRYRKEAQQKRTGEYSLQGDGTVEGTNTDQTSNSEQGFLDTLPPADPDAKEGLTPEFWEAIKDQLSADELTVFLNELRLQEQATTKN